MKAVSSLGCAIVVCLLATIVQAQIPNCETNVNSAELFGLLQKSPSDQCRMQMLDLVGVRDYEEEAETVFRALAVVCEPACLEYVRTVALACVPSYVDTLGLACGKNVQDTFCFQTVALNNGSSLLAQCLPQPTTAENATDESSTNSTTEVPVIPTQPPFMCSNVCRGALEEFRATHGCCVSNAFNTSAFGLLTYGIASYGLWRACDVETVPGNCSSPFVDATTIPIPTDSGYVLATHGILSLLFVLIAFLVIV